MLGPDVLHVFVGQLFFFLLGDIVFDNSVPLFVADPLLVTFLVGSGFGLSKLDRVYARVNAHVTVFTFAVYFLSEFGLLRIVFESKWQFRTFYLME